MSFGKNTLPTQKSRIRNAEAEKLLYRDLFALCIQVSVDFVVIVAVFANADASSHFFYVLDISYRFSNTAKKSSRIVCIEYPNHTKVNWNEVK